MPKKHSTTFTGYVSNSTLKWMLEVIERSITAEHPRYKFVKAMAFRHKLSLDHFDTLENVFLEFWNGEENPPGHVGANANNEMHVFKYLRLERDNPDRNPFEMTVTEFCRMHRMSRSTFYHYKQRWENRRAAALGGAL